MKDEENQKHSDRDDHGQGAHPNRPDLFVDNVPYQWEKETITGADIRALASLPDDVEIFHKVPGRPDELITDNTNVDLSIIPGPDHFSTQPVGSQAG